MEWTADARELLSKVPFFVRKRVKKRVEEEAGRVGASGVTGEHVRACQRRFLDNMEDEVKGYQVETCFGAGGCPNRAVEDPDLIGEITSELTSRGLREFLKARVGGPLKMHHEFRVCVSDCPNACSRPQIVDFGLIGACLPEVSAEEACTQCGVCVDICREKAVELHRVDGRVRPVVDYSRCLACGQCIRDCPSGTLRKGAQGYRVLLGGKLGRHPRLGRELPGVYSGKEVLGLLGSCLDHYTKHCVRGERFGEILQRKSIEALPDAKGETVC